MKSSWREGRSVLNLIAVPFAVIALLSTYGLYATMNNYAMSTETTFNAASDFSDVTLSFEPNGDAVIYMTLTVQNNRSKLALRLNTVVCRLYTTDTDDKNFVSIGSRSFLEVPEDALVPAGSSRSVQIEARVKADTNAMTKFQSAQIGQGYVLTMMGEVRYKLADFPDVSDMTFAFGHAVVVPSG
ncbi:MAG: hypothetical protein HZB92_04890 [Euryarchaeota archaeon]|nr:hypothetical protein [Euryarchaeota archaeon]